MAIMGEKRVTNSAIGRGSGEGVILNKSQRVTIANTTIHDFVLYGLTATGSSNFVLENNILTGVRPELDNKNNHPHLKWDFPNGGYELSGSHEYTAINNTAAGTWHFGFKLPAHKCDERELKIRDNIAHSISGLGVIVQSGGGDCSEFSHFKGYKNHLSTVHHG